MNIDRNSKEPIYKQIRGEILESIQRNIYHSGEQIPSERDISLQYGVSRMTARQAINELVKNGMLYREKGRGTFVAAPKFKQNNIKSFTNTLKEMGYEPSTEVLEFTIVHHLTRISELLDLNEGSRFYKIKRVRYADYLPAALETVYLPKDYCIHLDKYDMTESLYKILEKHGHIVDAVSCEIDACISDRMMMKIFNVNKPIPLLKIKGVNYSQRGIKLYYEEAYYRSDLYKYQVDIHRRMYNNYG